MSALLALCAVLGSATPAWAVVVEVGVKDSAGQPVAGATVKIGDLETTTDEDGTARADVLVEPGTRVEAVVTYRDPRTGRDLVVRRAFRAVEGAQINVALPGGPPGRRNAGLPGGLVGGMMGRQVINDSGLDRSRFTDRLQIGSTPGTTPGSTGGVIRDENREKTPEEIAEANRIERKNHRFGPEGGVVFSIPLAGAGGWGGMNVRRAWRDGTAGAQPGPGGSGGGWRLYPALTVGIGRTSVEFESVDLETAANTQRFGGDGALFAIGAEAAVVPCDCAFLMNGGYEYTRTGAIDMTRRTNIQDLVGANVQVVRDAGAYRYRAHAIRAGVGFAFRHVSPWAGVRITRWRASLDLATDLDFSGALGVPASQSLTAANVYEVSMAEAIGGFDVRVPRTPLLLRLQGTTNGDDHSFGFGFGLAFGR